MSKKHKNMEITECVVFAYTSSTSCIKNEHHVATLFYKTSLREASASVIYWV